MCQLICRKKKEVDGYSPVWRNIYIEREPRNVSISIMCKPSELEPTALATKMSHPFSGVCIRPSQITGYPRLGTLKLCEIKYLRRHYARVTEHAQ